LKTIETVRAIREKQAMELENKSSDGIMKYFKKKAETLHKRIDIVPKNTESTFTR
jgi:hypothetical protein